MLVISKITCCFPVQGYGDFDGNPFFYSAKRGVWLLDVTPLGTDPVDPLEWGVPVLYHGEGDDPTHGHEEGNARQIIEQEYEKFLLK